MVDVVTHHQEIDIVVTAMVGVDVEFLGALSIVVCILFETLVRCRMKLVLTFDMFLNFLSFQMQFLSLGCLLLLPGRI